MQFSLICRRHLTRFLTNHLLRSLELLSLDLTYLGGYALTWWTENSILTWMERHPQIAVLHQVFLKGQSLALGLILPFLIYIYNSVDSAAIDGNCIMLMADDMLFYRTINNLQDFIYVSSMYNKVIRSNLRLNSAKCKTMIVTRRRTIEQFQFPYWNCMVKPLGESSNTWAYI